MMAVKPTPGAMQTCTQYKQQAESLKKTLEQEKTGLALDKWKLYQGLYEDLSTKGSAILAQTTKDTFNPARHQELSAVSQGFFANMGQIQKRLQDLKPITAEDCDALNQKTITLALTLIDKAQELTQKDHPRYQSELTQLKSAAAKIYLPNTPHKGLKAGFDMQVKQIENRLILIAPKVEAPAASSYLSAAFSGLKVVASAASTTVLLPITSLSNTASYIKAKTIGTKASSEGEVPAETEQKSAFEFMNDDKTVHG